MTKKHFGPKSLNCWSYFTAQGEGWEVGFHFQGRPLFVGNFIHKKEATQWFSKMNSEITKFSGRYTFGPKFPVTFFTKFIGNHLYSTYYSFLDKVFAQHKSHFKKAVSSDLRKYSSLKKTWSPKESAPFYKSA
ncbi:MAG: hypothetical protein ABIR96_10525 [Bdellovibrionota bacterium]